MRQGPWKVDPQMTTITRRSFVKRSGAVGGGLVVAGPLGALTSRAAGQQTAHGYGPLVNKGDLWLPAAFDYQVISRQGTIMSDGQPTPGIFDGMGAYPGPGRDDRPDPQPREPRAGRRAQGHHRTRRSSTTRRRSAATRSCASGASGHDATRSSRTSRSSAAPRPTARAACAGGTSGSPARRSSSAWRGKKHGYIFEIDARATGPVAAVPVPQAAGGRTRRRSSARASST